MPLGPTDTRTLQASRHPDYAQFFDAIRRTLPEVTIVGDSTQPTYHAWLHYETEKPRRYFHSTSAVLARWGTPYRQPLVPSWQILSDQSSA